MDPLGLSCRTLLVAFIAALLATLMLAPSAWAESPFRVSTQLEDHAQALGDQRDEAQAAIDQLQANERVQLWMVYVETFSGMSGRAWAAETFDRSGLGLRDLLIAVAIDDREYAYSADEDFPLTNEQLNDVMTNDVEPELQNNDWPGAVIGAATGLEQTLSPATPEPADGTSDETDAAAGGFSFIWIVVIVVVVVIVLLTVRSLRRAARGRGQIAPSGPPAPQPQAATSLDELRKQANLQLVETDDAIKTSEDEIGFAAAEFGDEATKPFQVALEQARAELSAAFKLRKQLDDTHDELTQRGLLTEILRNTGSANARLDAEVEHFDKLRDLEHNVPQVVSSVEQRLVELEARLPKASQTLTDLTAEYARSALAPVAANVDEARSRVAFAREQIAAGQSELAGGHRGEAIVAAVAAEEAAGQGAQLLDAIERLGDDLEVAAGRIAEAVAETRRDVAEAQALSEGSTTLAPLVATASAAVSAAETAAAPQGGRDPLTALLRLNEADDALESALQKVRDEQARRARAAASLERSLLAARSELASAGNFITTHRGVIGAGPRSLLADGQRQLDQALALSQSDPVTAAQYAARAQELAAHAVANAQAEASSASLPPMAPPGGSMGGGMGNVAGAIIGGILLNAMLGGGGRSHGGGFGGGFSPGSFGGGGTRTRRSGGGRF